MPTFNPVSKKFSYTAADLNLIEKARRLFSAMAEYDGNHDAKRDATSAFNAAQHCLEHVKKN